MNLVLLGPPGAGKGTQATRIAQAMGLVHLSSGDILRAERKNKTDLGKKAQDYMDRGVLVPDDLILAMMMEHIGRAKGTAGCLLDGFPRTVAQAERLDWRLTDQGSRIDRVVDIVVNDAEVTRRLTGRWTCPQDGRIYHEIFSPPKKAGFCDDCGTPLTRRKDDEPAVVSQRLKTYHEETQPLAAYYTRKGVLREVDGSRSVDEVTAAIQQACRAS